MSIEVDPNQFDEGDDKVKFSDLFIFQRVLGNGSFGIVVAAFQKPHMKECAVKIIMKKSLKTKNLESLWKESHILQQMNHPNIVKFVAINESETRIFLVMELVRGGQLKTLIQERNKKGQPLSDEEASTVMRSLFSGLQYIHGKDIVHRDLKPENILLDDLNDLSSVKICDFGLSAQYNTATCTRSFLDKCGTDIFMAPELWRKKRYSKPVDMYSCGIILYMILSGGKHPLYKQGDNHESYFKKLEGAQWPILPNFNKYSKDLFLKLVQEDPYLRYTVEQVQSHPWVSRRFNEDIPLTSSEKIAAFSHSQILSRMMKSMYLMYALPNIPPKNIEHNMTQETDPRENTESLKTDEENFKENLAEAINITEQDSPLLEPENAKEMQSSFIRKDTNELLLKKPSPSKSISHIRGDDKRNTGKDISAIGSLAELETTHGSNPSSLQEETKTKTESVVGEIVMQTEPARFLEDAQKKEIPMRILWAPDRAASAMMSLNTNSSTKRKEVKNNKIPEKGAVSGNPSRDKFSVDMGQKWKTESGRGETGLKDKDMNRHLGTLGNMESEGNEIQINTTRNMVSATNLMTPCITGLAKTKPDLGSFHPLRYGGDSTGEILNFSGKKQNETSKNQTMGRKVRKGTTETTGPLPILGKLKQRQTSLPAKKKGNGKDKQLSNKQGDKKSSNTTGGPQSMILDSAPITEKFEEKRSETPFKTAFEEKRIKTQQDVSRRNASLLAAFKTPVKEDRDFVGGLPSIRQEIRKTRTNWVHHSEKVLPQKKDPNFVNLSGALIPHAPAKLVKAVSPFNMHKY